MGGNQSTLTRRVVHRTLTVNIGTDGLKLRFRDKGLAQMVTEVGIMTGKSPREAA